VCFCCVLRRCVMFEGEWEQGRGGVLVEFQENAVWRVLVKRELRNKGSIGTVSTACNDSKGENRREGRSGKRHNVQEGKQAGERASEKCKREGQTRGQPVAVVHRLGRSQNGRGLSQP
jgi:hypothetical protein